MLQFLLKIVKKLSKARLMQKEMCSVSENSGKPRQNLLPKKVAKCKESRILLIMKDIAGKSFQ